MRSCLTCGVSLEGRYKQTKFCCRLCYRRNTENKNKYAERTKIFQKAHSTELKRRFNKLRYKCGSEKLPFGLTFEEYEWLINKGCFYCSASLRNETGCGLDRVEPALGYVWSNILPCCGKCNQIRNIHLTVEEMQAAMIAVLRVRAVSK